MMRLSLRLVVPALLFATPAFAQIGGRPFEISGQAGWFAPDARAHVESGIAFGGTLGWRLRPGLVLEGQALMAPSKADTLPQQDHDWTSYGLDLRFNLRPAEQRVVPYILLGMAMVTSKTTGTPPPDELQRGAPSAGLGGLFSLGSERGYLRLQVRDTWFRGRDSREFGNHFSATAGFHWVLGGKPKDVDLDGVRDWLDECPNTVIGAKVDARGCPLDSDQDKVFDGLDQCEGTPAGCTVDKNGCPTDADQDGVCDGVDQCADTPKGATVDATGCPKDSDGDGVVDGIDQCPGTAAGAKVDEKGCVNDDDLDGVPNGVDQCPETSPGLKVDAQGCPIEVMERETELLDTGMIRLSNVNFETAKADILAESHGVLDVVGQVLRRWPELRIEIGGHTDSRGSNAYNQRLSEARARSVLSYLTTKYPELKPEQFSARGYGEVRPLVPNSSDLNMAKNRRVEFVVLNKDVLKREVERRRLLRKDEGTPPPAPSPAPADTTAPSVPPSPPPSPPETPIAPPDTTTAPPDTSGTPRR